MKVLSTILFFVFFTVSIYSQGAYLERGQSGLGVSAAFSSNENVTGIGAGVGYSVSGIFDFGVSVNYNGFDEQLFNEDISAIAVSPSVTFYPLKHSENNPITIAIGAGFQWQTFSNDVLDRLNIDMSGRYFSIGGSIIGNFIANNSIKIQPSLGVTYATGSSSLEDENGNEETVRSSATGFNFGLAFAFDMSPKNIFLITPQVGFSEEITSIGLGLGFVFSTN